MFYQTTVKSVGSSGVVDVQGKFLTFIGNLPVKEGDTVFTDGKVIFGHAPPKGSTAIFDEPGGIPVLGYADENKNDELRGYFTTSGNFKKYDVAEDDWITNSSRKFAHGSDTFNGERVIDAEISSDGDEFVVTSGFYRKCRAVKYNNHLFYMDTRQRSEVNPTTGAITFTSDYKINMPVRPVVGQEISLGEVAHDIDTPVVIYKNGEKFLEISLEPYVAYAIEQCNYAKEALLNKSADISSPTDLPQQPSSPVNWIKQPSPPSQPFIALSYAHVDFFRVDEDGNWDALISSAAYGYCFLNILLNGSVFERKLFNSSDGLSKSFSKSLILGLDNLESAIFDENLYPFLQIEKYPNFVGEETDENGAYTDEYKKYIEDKLAYYIPLVRFKHYKWATKLFVKI